MAMNVSSAPEIALSIDGNSYQKNLFHFGMERKLQKPDAGRPPIITWKDSVDLFRFNQTKLRIK